MGDEAPEADRTAAYRLLSACLCLPDRSLLLEEDVHGRLAAALASFRPAAVGAAEALGRHLRDEEEQDLRVDYARLFVGPGKLLAPPYGSVYLEEGGRVFGETTLEVLSTYRAHGLDVDRASREVPDHLALELEFLHFLGWKARQSEEEGRSEEARALLAERSRFREGFVTPWVPAFCERVREAAERPYFRELASCLERTLG